MPTSKPGDKPLWRTFPAPMGYLPVWRAMRHYTQRRDRQSPDRIWCMQHHPVVTHGARQRRTKAPRTMAPSNGLAEVYTDRGGGTTIHNPGQILLYLLVDLRRAGIGVKTLTCNALHLLNQCLHVLGFDSHTDLCDAGVYVHTAKVGSIGLRVTRGCAYHGLSLNYDNDLRPYASRVICGRKDRHVARLTELRQELPLPRVLTALQRHFTADRLLSPHAPY